MTLADLDPWLDDLLVGVCQYLDAAGVATWAPTSDVTALTRPIIKGDLPDKPDLAVGLRPYGGSDDDTLADVVQPVQFWVRGRSLREAVGVSGLLFAALHGAVNLNLGGVPVSSVRRIVSAPMGRDGVGREQLADSYEIAASRPNAWRDA